MIKWIVAKFIRHYSIRFQPVMIRVWGHWYFIDMHNQIWKIEYTGVIDNPIRIQLWMEY